MARQDETAATNAMTLPILPTTCDFGSAAFPSPRSSAEQTTRTTITDDLTRLADDASSETQLGEEIDLTPTHPRHDASPDGKVLLVQTRGTTPQPRQRKFGFDAAVIRDSIVRKLRLVHRDDLADKIDSCHREQVYKRCCGCRHVATFYNRCEVFFCPICIGRLARDRRKSVEWWSKLVGQPKHVVLTTVSVPHLSREYVAKFKADFSRLRRSKFASNWLGGFWSLDTTRTRAGWHLHLHGIVDARWIDRDQLEKTWARIREQAIAIVRVYDARESNYVAECTKYIVDGQQMGTWESEEIAEFIDAFTGVRCFGTFGALYKQRAEWRAFKDQMQTEHDVCACGSTHFEFIPEWEWEISGLNSPRPPPTLESHRHVKFHAELFVTLHNPPK